MERGRAHGGDRTATDIREINPFYRKCLLVKSQLRTNYHEQPRTKGRHLTEILLPHHLLADLYLVLFFHPPLLFSPLILACSSPFFVSAPHLLSPLEGLCF